MTKPFSYLVIVVLSLIVSVLAYMLFTVDTYHCDISIVEPIDRLTVGTTLKTRGRYLVDNAALSACLEIKQESGERAQKLFPAINGAYIKARSYAIINKIFFWLSIVLAVCVVGFPIIRAFIPEESRWKTAVGADQLPAITLIAGLSFALYSDYKQKQTSAEDLMAYAFYSPETVSVAEITEKVRKGLAEIDQGHDFSKLLDKE